MERRRGAGGSDLRGNGGSLSPQFQYLALDPDRHLLLASDNGPYLRDALGGIDDDLDDDGLSDVASAVTEPLSAAVYTGDFACKSLAMAQADVDDQSTADQLVAQAGRVDPMTGFAMAVQADRQVTVAMAFETDDQARRNADSRAKLAAGPAPGQGGDFGERFDARAGDRGRLGGADGAEAGRRQPGAVRPVYGTSLVRDLLGNAEDVSQRQPQPLPPTLLGARPSVTGAAGGTLARRDGFSTREVCQCVADVRADVRRTEGGRRGSGRSRQSSGARRPHWPR